MKQICFFIIFIIGSVMVSAQSLADAEAAFGQGDYADAIPGLKAAVDAKPRDAALQHKLGVAYMRTGNYKSALAHLAKGTSESKVAEAEIAFMEYRFDDAEELLDKYEAALKKARKKADPLAAEVEALRGRIDAARNMLDRVEKIVVVDSIAVDKEDFLRAYRLSREAGSLRSVDALPQGMEAAEPTAVYVTPAADRMIWAAPDANENFRLVQTFRLDDGSWEEPRPLGDALGEGADANYPFLMPDGVTLYFASDGENSLGGYDIFLSRFDGEQFLQPQNVGMPYNSPYDDYMMAVDEATGAGWWATDRNRLDDSITIYIFVPQELRINYPVDTPSLPQFALLTSVAVTQQSGDERTAVFDRINEALSQPKPVAVPSVRLSLPDGRVVTASSQLHSQQARSLMNRYVDALRNLESCTKRLDQLRKDYKSDTTLAASIRQAESEESNLRRNAARLRNEVISAECN